MVRDSFWILWLATKAGSVTTIQSLKNNWQNIVSNLLQDKKVWTERSTGKVMLSIFWNSEVVIHHEFLLQSGTLRLRNSWNDDLNYSVSSSCLLPSTWQYTTVHDAAMMAAIKHLGFKIRSQFDAEWLLPFPLSKEESQGQPICI